MLAVAILSEDGVLRAALERAARNEPSLSFAASAEDSPTLLRLSETNRIDVLLVAPEKGERFNWSALRGRFHLIAILEGADEENELEAFRAGASAVLDRAAARAEIVAAINIVAQGYFLGRQNTLESLLNSTHSGNKSSTGDGAQPALTRRELEVLAAMVDGISNKAIARRLGITVHTAKFHVASILEKLGADSRTEAVTKAAQRGIVML